LIIILNGIESFAGSSGHCSPSFFLSLALSPFL